MKRRIFIKSGLAAGAGIAVTLRDLRLRALAEEVAEESGVDRVMMPQVTLAEYARRVKGLILDPWQQDLCARLEKAFWLARADYFDFVTVALGAEPDYVVAPNGFKIDKEEFDKRKGKGSKAAIHAMPQAGKSVIISQAYPCWILGYDPTHRFRLATYNENHSMRFSGAIRRTLASPEHKAIFTDPRSFVNPRSSAKEWYTAARLDVNDGQPSFIALGLSSGFVGSGADTLIQDDPYASAEEALSENTRDKTWRFQTETAGPRLREYSNNFIMFHRYHQQDQGGRAIASGEFELWRYAAQADGDYEDDETGLKYPCFPLGRPEGEYLSARYPATYYEQQQKNASVWSSQFQGRPTSKTGTMFDVTQIKTIQRERVPQILYWVRAWDNAATEGDGDYTAGLLVGVDGADNFYLFDVQHGQVNTAGRKKLQKDTAKADGKLVLIHLPQDPASAGKDVAVEAVQKFRDDGYQAVAKLVTGTKTARAYNFSLVVNEGRFHFVTEIGGETSWDQKGFKNELRDFPVVGAYDDRVDAGADAVNHLQALLREGLVVKASSDTNILSWKRFSGKFGDKIPAHCDVSVACRIETTKSKPSGYAIVVRAAENMHLGETVFIVASARMLVDRPETLLQDLEAALNACCAGGKGQAQTIWIAKGNDEAIQLASEKYDLQLQEFEDDARAGLPEMGWYFQRLPTENPFFKDDPTNGDIHYASRAYILSDDGQVKKPTDEGGQISLRQDLGNWSFNDKGDPQAWGGVVADCVRMNLWNFSLTATEFTKEERTELKLPEHLRNKAVGAKLGTPEFQDAYWARKAAQARIQADEQAEEWKQARDFRQTGSGPARHDRYRRR